MENEPLIPLSRVAAFVRQFTHDVRNSLNSLELETALLREVVTDEEGKDCVERIRSQVRSCGAHMRTLSTTFQKPESNRSPIEAAELFLIWKEEQAELKHPVEVKWQTSLEGQKVSVDVAMMTRVFHELLENAGNFSKNHKSVASASADGKSVLFELREQKTEPIDPSNWGEPFSSTRRGGYGLGLWSARRIVEANQGTLTQSPSPGGGELVTTITFPICI